MDDVVFYDGWMGGIDAVQKNRQILVTTIFTTDQYMASIAYFARMPLGLEACMFEWIFSVFRPMNVAAQQVPFGLRAGHEYEELDSLIKSYF